MSKARIATLDRERTHQQTGSLNWEPAKLIVVVCSRSFVGRLLSDSHKAAPLARRLSGLLNVEQTPVSAELSPKNTIISSLKSDRTRLQK